MLLGAGGVVAGDIHHLPLPPHQVAGLPVDVQRVSRQLTCSRARQACGVLRRPVCCCACLVCMGSHGSVCWGKGRIIKPCHPFSLPASARCLGECMEQ